MKKPFTLLSICFVIIFITSCFSTLKVRVDALDMRKFKNDFANHSDMNLRTLKNLTLIIEGKMTERIQLEFVDSVICFLKSNLGNDTSTFQKESLYIRNTYSIVAKYYMICANSYRNALLNNINKPSDEMMEYHRFKVASDSLYTALNLFSFMVLDTTIRPNKEILVQPILEKKLKITEEISSVFGVSILSDPNASILANLNKSYWMKDKKDLNKKSNSLRSTINLSRARTFFGNSDIAVVMRSPGEFVVKGVRVDADEAVRTSFKVLNQGIKYLAASYGVPVKSDAAQGGGKVIIPELDSLNSKTLEYDLQKEKLQNSLDIMLSVLNQTLDQVNSKDSTIRLKALERISKSAKNFKQ